MLKLLRKKSSFCLRYRSSKEYVEYNFRTTGSTSVLFSLYLSVVIKELSTRGTLRLIETFYLF